MALDLPTDRGRGQDGARASCVSRDKMLKRDGRILDPTPTKHSASESTVERLSTNAAEPTTGGTLGTKGTTEVHPAATKGARRNTFDGTSDYHHERYATQDPYCPPLRLPHGELMKRSAVRQFDATSTEPADTHNHFTTHMPVAHARRHRSTSNHDPPDRVHGQGDTGTMGKDTPRPPGTRETEGQKKKKF